MVDLPEPERPGQPHGAALVAVDLLAVVAGDGALVPDDVGRFLFRHEGRDDYRGRGSGGKRGCRAAAARRVATWGAPCATRAPHDDGARDAHLVGHSLPHRAQPRRRRAHRRRPAGSPGASGSRDQPFEGLPAWVGRARRAHANLVENLVVFAALVLVAVARRQDERDGPRSARSSFWGRIAPSRDVHGRARPRGAPSRSRWRSPASG